MSNPATQLRDLGGASSAPDALASSASPSSLLSLSATRLAALIRSGELSAREVVERHILQTQRVNPTLNALVRERFDAARAEADAVDEARAREPEKLPPLAGVPCTIKECFQLTGMPQSAGLWARRDVISPSDATAVERLRRAGAIPLGVTNLSELCMWMESNNPVYGRTSNPYDPRCTAGGSSGGEGALVGAGGVPFGLGSDIGGSIRMPAFFGGVFGHKPTGGLVPLTGQYPLPENEALRYETVGPLCRKAEDLLPLLRLLAGPDGKDPGCMEWTIGDPSRVRLDELTIYDVPDNGVTPVARDLRAAQRRAVEALAARGARVKRTHLPLLEESFNIWSCSLGAAQKTRFRDLLGNGQKIAALRELVRLAFGRSHHTFPALLLTVLERLTEIAPGRTQRYAALGRELREELAILLGARGVLLYPSYAAPAPRHNMPLWPPFNWVYTAILNILELPVTQVPLGLNDAGLPLGVQVVALHGNDHVTIAVATELERVFGGWVPPPRLSTEGVRK